MRRIVFALDGKWPISFWPLPLFVGLVVFVSAANSAGAIEQIPIETADESQEEATRDVLEELLESFSAYGSLRTRLLITDDTEELQNGASRIGLRLRRPIAPRVVPELTALGLVEVQVNLVENPTIATAGDSTNSELLTDENVDAFETRLGYVGFEFGDLASVAFGKQWAVYYDVAGWTDQFYVFGGTSLGAYNGGTDGGGGTGRADQAIVGRLDLDWLVVGAQYQVRGFDVISGRTYGGSLRARPAEWVELGLSFNRADLADDELGESIATTEHPQTLAAGIRLRFESWLAAFVYAHQVQTEPGTRAGETVLVDSDGYEFYARTDVALGVGAFGGFNIRAAEDAGLEEGLDVEQYYLGVDWFFDDHTFVYVQARSAHKGAEDAIVTGVRYNFELSSH